MSQTNSRKNSLGLSQCLRLASMLCFVLVSTCNTAYTDSLATSFYVLESAVLSDILKSASNLKNLDIIKLEDVSLATGYFKDDCSVYLKTKENQYRIVTSFESGKLVFSFRMYSRNKGQIFSSNGVVQIGVEFSAKDLWQQEKYVIIFRKQNLSQ